ncbi:MAG: acyl-CoA thioesterase [Campylobacterota bacterium]|nr:acyl-CoA thioesterase [Campylobacterota bacterium]
MQNKTLTMSVLITPDMANFTGMAHGGDILKLLDQVAYACASRYSGNYVVTLSVDMVLFKNPIPIGSLVTFLSTINYTGNTSMEVGIKVVTENIQKQSVIHTNTCYFTIVSVNKDGKPMKVPALELDTDEDKRRFHNGKKRKEISIQKQEILLKKNDTSFDY